MSLIDHFGLPTSDLGDKGLNNKLVAWENLLRGTSHSRYALHDTCIPAAQILQILITRLIQATWSNSIKIITLPK